MTSTATSAQFRISAQDDLEELFFYFSQKFANLPALRSLVEGDVTEAEVECLKEWFVERWEVPYWCEDGLKLEAAHGATRQEMFGALLLILATSQCRDHADEDAVWPAVTGALRGCKSFSTLFIAGQPTPACKKSMAAGVRRLGLRNLIDRHGKQEYFDTLKLQFGFTRRGAERRLAEWLAGFEPLPVKILSGCDPEYSDLKSESFIVLWKTLKRFRDSQIAKEHACSVLQTSPWIRSNWAEGLLDAATKCRPTKAPRTDTSADLACAIDDEVAEWVCEPILRWPPDSKPQLVLRLAKEPMLELLSDCTAVELSIDYKTVDRWTRLESGDWRWNRELACPLAGSKLNFRPKVLLIKTHDDRVVREVDLREFGVAEPVVIFDLGSGRRVDAANKLDPNRDYALICDSDLSVEGASQSVRLREGCAFRINRPWRDDLRVTCNGALYWAPRIGEKKTPTPIRVSMALGEGPPVELGAATQICIMGAPRDALSINLRLGNLSYDLVRQGDAWQTNCCVKVSVQLAIGDELVRVRVAGPNYNRIATHTLDLNLLGIAQRQSGENGEMYWSLVKRDRPLERSAGVGRARVFAGKAEDSLFEGFHQIGKINSRGLEMNDLHGWGAPLVSGPYRLVNSIQDHGLFGFLPNLFRRQTGERLVWRVPTTPRSGHQVVVWPDLSGSPVEINVGQVDCSDDGMVWTLPQLGAVSAGAVA